MEQPPVGVAGGMRGVVRGHAGAPLRGPDGHVSGTLCIVDPERPLDLNATELDALSVLAAEVAAELERTRRLPSAASVSLAPRQPALRDAEAPATVRASRR